MRAQKDNGIYLLREYINNDEQNVGRNMDIRVHVGEVPDESEEELLKTERKNVVVMCYSVLWKKLVSDESGHLSRENFK